MKPFQKKLSSCWSSAREGFTPSALHPPHYWGLPVSILRATLASTLFATLLLTPLGSLFQPVYGDGVRPNCETYRLIPNLYCIFPTLELGKLFSLIVLLLVIVGLAPRVTGILHYWVQYSFMDGIAISDGGDQIATVLTLLLIPLTLTDSRTNMWAQPRGKKKHLSLAIAAACLVGIKVQMSALYLQSSIEKISQAEWQIGNNLYYTFIGPFGLSGWVKQILQPLFDQSVIVAAMTWSVIAIELLIGIALVVKTNYRLWLFLLAVALHGGIAILMGLWSFALNMIAADLVFLVPFGSIWLSDRFSSKSYSSENENTETISSKEVWGNSTNSDRDNRVVA